MKYYTFLDGWLGEAVAHCLPLWTYEQDRLVSRPCPTWAYEQDRLVARPCDADYILVAGWKYKLPLFGPLMLNVHPSPLPAYRGPQPLRRQQEAGERYIGLTVHEIDKDLDTGPIRVVRYIDLGGTKWTLDEAGRAIRSVLREVVRAAVLGGPGWPQSYMEVPND